MIEAIVTKIEQYIHPKPLNPYKVDETFLYRLYSLLLKECVSYDEIENYLVAFGLLHLHEQTHQRLLVDPDHINDLILDGDYFYSLYYSYAAHHAFHLIEHNFASHLSKKELHCIDESLPLLETIQTFLQQGELYYGVS